MHGVAWRGMWICVRSKDAQKQLARTSLSNDRDKNCNILYFSAATRFPHVKMVLFSDEEFINQWKAGL